MVSQEKALAILQKYVTKKENLRHNLDVAAGMRALAEKFAPKEADKWEIIGMLHDIDIECYDEDIMKHTMIGGDLLLKEGLPQNWVYDIRTHNEALGMKRETVLQHCLYSCDGLTGLIHAYVLMRPDNDIMQAKVKSIMKKLKDKAFARGVHREEITCVTQTLEMDVRDFVEIVLAGMQKYMIKI